MGWENKGEGRSIVTFSACGVQVDALQEMIHVRGSGSGISNGSMVL